MPTSYAAPAILGVIFVIGAITFAIRASFIALFGWLDAVPAWFERALRYVPAAVLAALALPAMVVVGPEGSLAVDKLVAGGLAAGVAWRTENVFATMAAGMGTLWLVRLVL